MEFVRIENIYKPLWHVLNGIKFRRDARSLRADMPRTFAAHPRDAACLQEASRNEGLHATWYFRCELDVLDVDSNPQIRGH